MSKKEKYQCPVCGTRYSHASMAKNCIKTEYCRWYNAPHGARKHAYLLQINVATILLFFALPIEEQTHDKEVRNIVHEIAVCCYSLIELLNELGINQEILINEHKKTIQYIYKVWGEQTSIENAEIPSLLKSLVEEIIEDLSGYWKEHPHLTSKKKWEALLPLLDDFDKANSFPSSDITEKEEAFFSYLWPQDNINQRPMLLYLVNEHIWVVGRTRADIREIVKKELGLTKVKLEGIPLNEKLEDGRRAYELIELAHGIPMIIGRTE